MATVLLVDDELTTVVVLKKALESEGHRVLCASDGARGLAVLEDNPDIDLLITDVVMPVLDGCELVAAIGRNPAIRGIPTIMMSGTVRMSEIVRLLENGASRFVAKPVSMNRLFREIASLLGGPVSAPVSHVARIKPKRLNLRRGRRAAG